MVKLKRNLTIFSPAYRYLGEIEVERQFIKLIFHYREILDEEIKSLQEALRFLLNSGLSN